MEQPPPFQISVPMQTPGADGWADTDPARTALVLVEPLYLGVAAALSLDAGWGSVELASSGDEAPIPLVSFEQRPTQRGGRCRVRGQVSDVINAYADVSTVLLGSLPVARPLAARLALSEADFVRFVPVPSDGRVSADAWSACGFLIRLFVEESDRLCELDDAAGMAVSLATEVGTAVSDLSTGARWRRHLALGGNEDDLRLASAIDSIGTVPSIVERHSDAVVVAPW